MDIMTIIGLLMGVGAILVGNWLEGGHIDSLVQATALLIVAGGTVGALMVQTEMKVFLSAMTKIRWLFFPPAIAATQAVDKILEWSRISRKEGLLGLEGLIDSESDPFSQKGLQLLVDGSEPETIRGIIEVEISVKEHFDTQCAKVFEGMGGYSPTIGIIGAVLGLIHVMNNLADPAALGPGIAVAFVATIYGVGLANLVFLPFAGKLKALIHHQSQFRDMIVEGIISIAEGENPRNIETKLRSFLAVG